MGCFLMPFYRYFGFHILPASLMRIELGPEPLVGKQNYPIGNYKVYEDLQTKEKRNCLLSYIRY